jgi:hypothetical protein
MMSQQHEVASTPEQGMPPADTQQVDVLDEFNAGFDLAHEAATTNDAPEGIPGETGKHEHEQKEDSAAAPESAAVPESGGQAPPQNAEQAAAPQYAPPLPPQQHAAPVQQPPPQPRVVEIGDELKEEFERLHKLNPQAAALAREDTPEGEAIRQRLETVGAESAEDKAALVLMQRAHLAQEAAQQQQAIDAHNRHFMGALQREVPEYHKMLAGAETDPNRKAELNAYSQEILAWINSKPYAEGAQLMHTATSERDPAKVADLIKRFESERKAKAAAVQPDPTGALAVPSKGSHIASPAVGNKDDFDGGFELSTASKN